MVADGNHPAVVRWYPPGTDDIPCRRRRRGRNDVGVWWQDDLDNNDMSSISSCSSVSSAHDSFEYCDTYCPHFHRRQNDPSVIIQYESRDITPTRRLSCFLGLFFARRAHRQEPRVMQIRERGHSGHGRRPTILVRWRTYVFGSPRVDYCPCERQHARERTKSKSQQPRHRQ